MLNNHTRLYIPPRTKLETIWRTVDAYGYVTWGVWTSCRDRNAPFEQMLGTHMSLNSDGSVARVTLRPDDTVDELHVMPAIGDEYGK